MIPFTAAGWLKAIGGFLSKVPRKVWYALAFAAFVLWLRAHWIGVGVERCQKAQEAAQAAAATESAEQEKAAPAVAQEARDVVAPKVQDRVRIIRETIAVPADCPAYPDRVQQAVREARAAADSVR